MARSAAQKTATKEKKRSATIREQFRKKVKLHDTDTAKVMKRAHAAHRLAEQLGSGVGD